LRRLEENTIGSSQWEIWKKENDGMITCSITKQLTILLQTTPLVCNPADDKEMCRYIVGKIIWEEMQKHTDIQNWNGWENWKNIETKML
jgi:hypothetical protein